MRIGDLLVGSGFISAEQLERALKEQKGTKKLPLGQQLRHMNYLSDQDLELVLQAQRKILFSSMSGQLAINSLKYAKQNKLSFVQATERVLSSIQQETPVHSRHSQGTAGAAAGVANVPGHSQPTQPAPPSAKPVSGPRFLVDPSKLMQQAEQAAAQENWDESIKLLDEARTVLEMSDGYSDDELIPVYCRLAAICLKTNRSARAIDYTNKAARLALSKEKLPLSSLSLLAGAATHLFRQGMKQEAQQLYLLVLPKLADFLPQDSAQFTACLKDALACAQQIKQPSRNNVKTGELLTRSGLLTEEEFQEALQKSKRIRQPLGKVLISNNLIEAQDLRNTMRVQLLCRSGLMPLEYAPLTVKAAGLAHIPAAQFFASLRLLSEVENADLAVELITKMDQLLITEQEKGLQDIEVALLAEQIGDICLSRKEDLEAETMLRRAHAVFAVAGEKYQHNLANTCKKVGILLIQQKKYPEAELLLLQAMEIMSRLLGDKHADVADILVDVGYLYYCQSNYYPAIGFLRSAWMIHNEDTKTEKKRYLLELLIKCFEQSGQSAEGDIYREQLKSVMD